MKTILIMFVCTACLISIIVLAAFIRSAQISHREEDIAKNKCDNRQQQNLLWIGFAISYLIQNLSGA